MKLQLTKFILKRIFLTEELPPDMPTPLGEQMTTTCYVDADHAHDTVTRRSVSGIILFLNGLPVKWYSK